MIFDSDIFPFMTFIYIFTYAVQISVVFIIFYVIRLSIKRTRTNNYFKSNVVSNVSDKGKEIKYKDVSKTTLAKFNIDDIEELKEYFYKMFVDFEYAYNNLDYGKMHSLSTEQLYENYYTGISLNLRAGKKKIIDRIRKKELILFELDSTNAKQVASMIIEVSYLNYTVDGEGNVISGDRINSVTEKFMVTYRKDYPRVRNNKCPNCGASLKDGDNDCKYCGSTINTVSEFKISEIKKIVN